MHSQESRDHTVTKFAAFVQVVYGTMCTKFCSKWTTFDKVIVKNFQKMSYSSATIYAHTKKVEITQKPNL